MNRYPADAPPWWNHRCSKFPVGTLLIYSNGWTTWRCTGCTLNALASSPQGWALVNGLRRR